MSYIARQNTPSDQDRFSRIPLSEPTQTGREWDYVRDCLETNWLSSAGPYVSRLEALVADRLGVTHAVATSSGTAALHVALQVADVGSGDEVLVPSLTFMASINAIRYLGACPVLIGPDADTGQMSVDSLERFIESHCSVIHGSLVNASSGRRVKAVMPVHILGHPCDMDTLLKLAQEYGISVVEDACEALGARYKGREIGSFGHIACFSFNGNKIVTAGAGGMIVTNRTDWGTRAKHLTTQAKEDGVEFVHTEVGYNYRLSNIHAAIGCAQIESLDERIVTKRRLSERYLTGLADIDGITPLREASWATGNAWLTAVRVDPERYGRSSRDLQHLLQELGIESRPLWQPAHLSPAGKGLRSFECDAADALYESVLCLPSSVSLSDEDQDRVIDAIASAANGVQL